MSDPADEHHLDCAKLSSSELKKKYESTYSTWRNMKQRRKAGAVIADEFNEFRDFLRIQGPRPGPEYTLDRTDNENPTYGPGLCKWISKAAQALNKTHTIYLTNSDGVTKPLVQWAEELGVSRFTLYQRHRQGCSDVEVLGGKSTAANDPFVGLPWPRDRAPQWEASYQQAIMDGAVAADSTREDFMLLVANRKLQALEERLKDEIDPYAGPTDEQQRDMVEYERWSAIRTTALARVKQLRAERAFANRPRSLGQDRERALLRATKGFRK